MHLGGNEAVPEANRQWNHELNSTDRYWSGLPFPLPGDLPDSGTEPVSPRFPILQVDSLPTEPLGKHSY